MSQPIIRGIQAVGAVDIKYRYNSSDYSLPVPTSMGGTDTFTSIDTKGGITLAGFRLDGEFLRAVQQIASSAVIPILGGGGVALTNNNRTGSLTITCAKVSTPDLSKGGAMYKGNGIGPVDDGKYYDMVYVAQIQQAQTGGDSVGASLVVSFMFCGKCTNIQFDGVTVGTVDPIGLSGNDAATYSVVLNYLNWSLRPDDKTPQFHD